MQERKPVEAVDLIGLTTSGGREGIIWSTACDDLNVNLMSLPANGSTPPHTNDQVDVLVVGVRGAGFVEVDGEVLPVAPGRCLVIRKGVSRSFRGGDESFAYVLCHRRRPGLWPEGNRRKATEKMPAR